MHVPGLKLSGVRSYQGASRSRLLLPKEEEDRSDTRLKDTSEPQKKDTSEPQKKTEVIVHPPTISEEFLLEGSAGLGVWVQQPSLQGRSCPCCRQKAKQASCCVEHIRHKSRGRTESLLLGRTEPSRWRSPV